MIFRHRPGEKDSHARAAVGAEYDRDSLSTRDFEPHKRLDAVTRNLQIDSHHLQPDPSALEGGQIPPQTVTIAAAGVPDGQPSCV